MMFFSRRSATPRSRSHGAGQLYYEAYPELVPLYPALPLADSLPGVTLLVPSLTNDKEHRTATAVIMAAKLAQATQRDLHIVQIASAGRSSDVDTYLTEGTIGLDAASVRISDASQRCLERPYYLPMYPNDIIVAAGWAESLLARRLPLEHPPIHLVQDREARHYPSGERALLAETSYRDPGCIPLCATKPLRDFFQTDTYPSFKRSLWFEPALPRFVAHPEKTVRKRLLICGSPDVQDSLFHVALQGVRQALQEGALSSAWDIYLESVCPLDTVELDKNILARRVHSASPEAQAAFEASLDMVVALAVGPAPGYQARRYAANGIPVVTSGYADTMALKTYGTHVVLAANARDIRQAIKTAASLPPTRTATPSHDWTSLDNAIASLVRRLKI